MSVHYESGDKRRPYVQCDQDGCQNRLTTRDNAFVLGTGMTPTSTTGWKTLDPNGERRDYCTTHAPA
jgi:hypothetical protein